MQDKESQKNLVLAIVLSMGVLFAWQFFYAHPREQERQTRIRQEQAAKPKEQAPARGDRQGRRSPGHRRQAGPAAAAGCGTGAGRPGNRRYDPAGRHRRQPARRHRDAEPQGVDLAQGRTHRRSGAGQIPRDRGPQEPLRGAVLALGRASPLLRRVRLDCGQGRDPADARPRHALARRDAGAR